MPHRHARVFRATWLLVLVGVPLIPLMVRPTAAQTDVACGAACTFLPFVNNMYTVYVESAQFQCSPLTGRCGALYGTIRNGLDVAVFDIVLQVQLPTENGQELTVPIMRVAFTSLAPGDTAPYVIGLESPVQPHGPPYTYSAFSVGVGTYTVTPNPTYRRLTVVQSRWSLAPGAQPPNGTFTITLRNDTHDRVSAINVILATDPDGVVFDRFDTSNRGRTFTPIPALAPGQQTEVTVSYLTQPPRIVYSVIGAEGVATP